MVWNLISFCRAHNWCHGSSSWYWWWFEHFQAPGLRDEGCSQEQFLASFGGDNKYNKNWGSFGRLHTFGSRFKNKKVDWIIFAIFFMYCTIIKILGILYRRYSCKLVVLWLLPVKNWWKSVIFLSLSLSGGQIEQFLSFTWSWACT